MNKTSTCMHGFRLAGLLLCALPGVSPVRAEDASVAMPSAPPLTRARPHPRSHDQAAAFARRLDLDAKQLAQVRQLLALRQAQMRRVWTNRSIDGDDRVAAAKAINNDSIAKIRALLTEEQRAKYFQPHPNESPSTEAQRSVADWMNGSRP